MKRTLLCVLVGLCCTGSAGCYQKVAADGTLVFSYQTWVPLLLGLGGLAALLVSIVLFVRKELPWGIYLAFMGVVTGGIAAPGMYLVDRVVVNQDEFYSRHGFWWNPISHQIRYEDLSQVELVVEPGRRQNDYHYSFDCSFKSGMQERVPLGEVMREALPEIAEQFRQHGVPVLLPPNRPNLGLGVAPSTQSSAPDSAEDSSWE